MIPNIQTASVKVMRSHDYCHFEVCLTSTLDGAIAQVAQVDDLRKAAARLADKAVEQYKVAKENAERIDRDTYRLGDVRRRVSDIEKIPEAECTPEEKAIVKKAADFAHHSRPRYDYQDDWEEQDDIDPYPEDEGF